MKRLIGILVVALVSVTLFNGCVPVQYTKTVVTHKDGSGRVTESIETETITEPHQETPRIESPDSIKLQNLK